MTPEEKQALDHHVQAVAQILYRNADHSRMSNLAEIEKTIREQLQEHVSPQIGVFLLAALQPQPQDTDAL
jgi:glutamate 5-kinase